MRTTSFALKLLAGFGWLAVGCVPGLNPSDAATDRPMVDQSNPTDTNPTDTPPEDTPPEDTPVDIVVTPRQPYETCTTNEECVLGRSGSRCDSHYPGGRCLPPCTADADCPNGGRCLANFCLPACARGANTCSEGESCLIFHATTGPVCWPSCNSASQCNEGSVCDPYVLWCLPQLATTGGVTGDRCSTPADCRSAACFPEALFPGIVGGVCASAARTPPVANFVGGSPLPATNCPSDARPWLFPGTTLAEGDEILCLKACTADIDCRPGFDCQHMDIGGSLTTDGACAPIDCLSAAHIQSPNNDCPATHHCVNLNGRGVCVAN